MSTLTEGLNYMDMEHQVFPSLHIDEYASKMGEDNDIITLSFMVKSYQVGEDLVAILAKEIQELSAQVEELKSQPRCKCKVVHRTKGE